MVIVRVGVMCVINPRQGKPGGAAAPAEAILLDENHNTAFPQRVSSQSIKTHIVNADTSITTQDLYVGNLHTSNIDFGGTGKKFILDNGTSGENTIPLKVKFRYPYSRGEGYITSDAEWDGNGYTVTLDTSTADQQEDIYTTATSDNTYIEYGTFRVSKFGICELYGHLKYSETGGWRNNNAAVEVSIPQKYFPKAKQINQILWSDNSRSENNRSICIALKKNSTSLKICALDPEYPFGDLLLQSDDRGRGYFHFTWAL